MDIGDFCYMWRGQVRQGLSEDQAALLAPVDLRNDHKQSALLLLHGFSSSPAVFRDLIPACTALYDAVVCPALPGHAVSIEAFAQSKSFEWLQAAEAACAELMKHYQTVDVMGLSLGGLLACHLAHRYPLHHLYLLAPALALRLKIKWVLSALRLLQRVGLKTLRNRAGNLYTQRSSELAYRRLPVSTIIELLSLVQAYPFQPPACPVDLFLGRHDAVVQSDLVAALFSGLPQVQVHWLYHSAHLLPLDGDIESIIACMKQRQTL